MSKPLAVIAGFGGINAAGRSFGHWGLKRMIHGALDASEQREVADDLRALTGQAEASDAQVLDGSLVRRISPQQFDPHSLPSYVRLRGEGKVRVQMERRRLPQRLPQGWELPNDGPANGRWVDVLAPAESMRANATAPLGVSAAGHLPLDMTPGRFYPSRQHPPGLELAVYAASEALLSSGLDIDALLSSVPMERVAVYSGTAIGQADERGIGSYVTGRLMGGKASARSVALGLPDASAAFAAAYVLGSAGRMSGVIGACASFLYTLGHATREIEAGELDMALVGAVDAQSFPAYMEGFVAAGAMATDEAVLQLQERVGEHAGELDFTRFCRPFGENVGMAIGDGGQFTLLMSDRLAVECGARVLGSVVAHQIHSDGVKGSISAPGVGNAISFPRAMAEAASVVGEQMLREHSFVMAHGSSTPLNRRTESALMSRSAQLFGARLPVTALKGMLGHTMGSASGDQFAAALGTFDTGWLPGIHTTRELAEDVATQNLEFLLQPKREEAGHRQLAFLNSKGFGGNNATTAVLGPQATRQMLARRHGGGEDDLLRKAEPAERAAMDLDARWHKGDIQLRYLYGDEVCDDEELQMEPGQVSYAVPGGTRTSSLRFDNRFPDMAP